MTATHAETHLRVKSNGKFELSKVDSGATPGVSQTKLEIDEYIVALHLKLEDLQRRLWAESRRSVLLVLQALDTGGKDGTIRRVFGGVNPQGVTVHGFRAPIGEELKHEFMWRIYRALPAMGEIGIFNRSHYEDVVATRVLGLIDEAEQKRRFKVIQGFEKHLVDSGIVVVKVFLHISKDDQKKRLQERVDDPAKRWKFSPADLETRKKWDDYQSVYSQVIQETSFNFAPWYVIPARHKWYRDWAAINLLVDTLAAMDPQYPQPAEGIEGTVIT